MLETDEKYLYKRICFSVKDLNSLIDNLLKTQESINKIKELDNVNIR